MSILLSDAGKPVRKFIWICGNSVILTSRKRAASQPYGQQLGIQRSRAKLYWHGVESMQWEDLLPLLREIHNPRPLPFMIIIHVGEDDLLPGNSISLLMAMKNDLGILRRVLPNTIIVWSSLLPTHILKKGQKPEEMEKLRKHINLKMVAHCNEIGIRFLSHILITSDKTSLFLPLLNVLSDAGADLFIADLMKILTFYGFYG